MARETPTCARPPRARRDAALLATALTALALLATCGGRDEGARAPRPASAPQHSARAGAHRARIPTPPPARFAPSPASVRDDAALPGDMLSAVDRCGVCHRDVFEQWATSAHRFSSMDNPFYEASFQAARRDRGVAIGRWCGGCHDPALLFAGDLEGPPIDRTHERAQLGVGCVLCHSIERLHDRTGNGNYVVDPTPAVVPRREGAQYAGVAEHVARVMRPVTRTAEFCGTCHKVGITEAVNGDHWLRGQNDFDAWEQSAYAGNELARHDPGVPRQTCQDCHMPLEPATRGDAAATNGMVRSHRFLGGHTLLAAWNRDPDALARQRAVLAGAIRLDVFRAPDSQGEGAAPLEDARLAPGDAAELDVVLVNERVGHRFPAGTADVADVWVELAVTDATGRRLAESGVMDARGRVEPDAHRLEVRPLDATGAPSLLRDPHRFRAVVYDTTLPPRAARVVRFGLRVPADARAPLRVRARLLHRRLADPYLSFACARAPQAQGRPCPTSPVTELAAMDVTVGSGAVAPAAQPPRWRRFYDHGRALGEVIVQERVAQARGSLATAASLAGDEAGPVIELARVAFRQGRADDAGSLLDRAARIAPDAPSIPYLRAVALADVWRYGETIAPLELARARVPRNVAAAEMLANALGLAGRHDDALRVIAEGLAVDPERPQLHNLQALELDAVGAAPEAALARDAYARYRLVDNAPAIRGRCRRSVPGCARESDPVHVHALHAPAD